MHGFRSAKYHTALATMCTGSSLNTDKANCIFSRFASIFDCLYVPIVNLFRRFFEEKTPFKRTLISKQPYRSKRYRGTSLSGIVQRCTALIRPHSHAIARSRPNRLFVSMETGPAADLKSRWRDVTSLDVTSQPPCGNTRR